MFTCDETVDLFNPDYTNGVDEVDIADQAFVKKVNQKLLLNEILKNSPISRAKLSEMTGLNKSTVSSQVNTLMKENLVFEIGQGQSSGRLVITFG